MLASNKCFIFLISFCIKWSKANQRYLQNYGQTNKEIDYYGHDSHLYGDHLDNHIPSREIATKQLGFSHSVSRPISHPINVPLPDIDYNIHDAHILGDNYSNDHRIADQLSSHHMQSQVFPTLTITKEIQIPHPVPYPVNNPVPYPVHVPVPVPVQVPRPYAVLKKIPVPIPIPIPFIKPIPIKIPILQKIAIPKPFPISIPKPFPIPIPVPGPFVIEKKVPIYLNHPNHKENLIDYNYQKFLPQVPRKVPLHEYLFYRLG